MHFDTKSSLKNNRNHTSKQTYNSGAILCIFRFPISCAYNIFFHVERVSFSHDIIFFLQKTRITLTKPEDLQSDPIRSPSIYPIIKSSIFISSFFNNSSAC
jgi:hypothetical protein